MCETFQQTNFLEKLVRVLGIAVAATQHDSHVSPDESRWDPDVKFDFLLHGADTCDFPRVVINESTRSELLAGYQCARASDECLGLGEGWALRPWIFEGLTANRDLLGPNGYTGKASMLHRFGSRMTVVSDSVAQSYGRKTIRFSDYVATWMQPPRNLSEALLTEAGKTWYLCNDNFWEELLSQYQRPPMLRRGHKLVGSRISSQAGSLSFGVGRSGSGLPFHFHGPQFVEVTQGKKRWFVTPFAAGQLLNVSPTMSTFVWLHSLLQDSVPLFSGQLEARACQVSTEELRLPPDVLSCTQKPGETLYLPPMWWHSTLNLGETVFFLDFVDLE